MRICNIDNFIRQLDWTTGCPDIWLTVILGVSVWPFLGDSRVNRETG